MHIGETKQLDNANWIHKVCKPGHEYVENDLQLLGENDRGLNFMLQLYYNCNAKQQLVHM